MKNLLAPTTKQTIPGRHRLTLRFSERRLLLFVGDVLCILIALLISYRIQTVLGQELLVPPEMIAGQVSWLFIPMVTWLGMAAVNELYDLHAAHKLSTLMQGLILTTIEVSVVYLFIFFAVGRPIFVTVALFGQDWQLGAFHTPPRVIAILFLILTFALIAGWRLGYIRVFSTLPLRRRALIVGAGWAGRTLAQSLEQTGLEYELIGFLDDDAQKQNTSIHGVPVLGRTGDLQTQIKEKQPDEVILAITNEIHADLLRSLMVCFEQGIPIKPMTMLYEEILERVPVEHLGSRWLPTPFWQAPAHQVFFRITKRFFDLFLALIGLTLLLPLLPLIALAIYIDSPGPIFYHQERLGRGGKPFFVYKFRSMIPNAEQRGKPQWAKSNDSRITRLGKYLRKTRIDELPQLLNVLKGDMSFVGPRPERPEFVEQLQDVIPFYRSRLAVKPGLTGWAQIKYRYGNTVEDALYKLQYDLYYIKHQSLSLDILIILRTIKVVLTFQGV